MNKVLFVLLLALILVVPASTIKAQNEAYGYVRTAVWSPEGTKLAVGTVNGVLLVTDNLDPIVFLERSSIPWDFQTREGEIVWSADGKYIAASGGMKRPESNIQSVFIWDTSTGSLIQTLEYNNADLDLYPLAAELVWSLNQDRIAGCFYDDELGLPDTLSRFIVWDISTGKILADKEYKGVHFHRLEWNSDNTFTAIHDILQVTLDAETLEFSPVAPVYIPEDVFLSPDGKYLASSEYGVFVTIENTLTGETFNATLPSMQEGDGLYGWRQISWNSDGSELIGYGMNRDNKRPNLYIFWNPENGGIIRETYISDNPPFILSPDKTQVATISLYGVSIYDVTNGEHLIGRDYSR